MRLISKKQLSILERELLSLPRNVDSQVIIDSNLNFLKQLNSENILTLIIKEILDDESLLNKIAGRSYEHVNHFDKIVLIDNKDPKGYRLTLHSWGCNYDKNVLEEELIHNHRFSFWSHIYRGTLISEDFVESETDSIERKIFNRYVYKPSETGNIHTCKFDKKAQLIKVKENSHKQGTTYYLNYSITHRVILPKNGKSLCTIVLRGPREREYTHTYNTFYPKRGKENNTPMMSPHQLKVKLTNILEARK